MSLLAKRREKQYPSDYSLSREKDCREERSCGKPSGKENYGRDKVYNLTTDDHPRLRTAHPVPTLRALGPVPLFLL